MLTAPQKNKMKFNFYRIIENKMKLLKKTMNYSE